VATRKITLTVEGDGPGADIALLRLVEALRSVAQPAETAASAKATARADGEKT